MNRRSHFFGPVLHATLIAVAFAASWHYWNAQSPAPSREASTIRVDSSQVLSAWRASSYRVFLFVSPTCPFCERNMPFYARLGRRVDSLWRAGTPVWMAGVIHRSVSRHMQRQQFSGANVRLDTLLQLTTTSFVPVGVSAVPTVAILDPDSQTRASWVGLQDSVGEQAILSAVRELTPD